MKIIQGFLILIGLFIISSGLYSCHHFYKATPQTTRPENVKASLTDSLAKTSRYFILRNGAESFNMQDISLSEDKKHITFLLNPVDKYQRKYITGYNKRYTYKRDEFEEKVLNEVHFFINHDSTLPHSGQYTMDLDKVVKIEVIEKDKKRTTSSYVLGSVGITVGVIVVAAIVIAATKSSCPFVSAYDGTDYTLQGEIYGGAIYPQLARHDYLSLNMKPLQDGNLQLKLSNELKENQFTDMIELLEITHDKNTVIYADEHGTLSTITSPVNAKTATLSNGNDVGRYVEAAGDNAILYMNDTTHSTNELTLTFENPHHYQNGKLLLNLKNSYFLDLLYGELAKGFGTYYATYQEKQKSKTASELNEWGKDQQIPLNVFVKTAKGWHKLAEITTIGPVATRNIVIPLKLPVSDELITQIKLSAGFLFWEIDYAAIDYSENQPFTVNKILPVTATDENNKDVLPSLLYDDANYLSQPEIGNIATITFKPGNTGTGKVHSYILHSKGYYEHIRQFDNEPDFSFLKQFKKTNGFPLYGMQLYKQMTNDQIKSMAGTQ
jgi:hypothetical protein